MHKTALLPAAFYRPVGIFCLSRLPLSDALITGYLPRRVNFAMSAVVRITILIPLLTEQSDTALYSLFRESA